MHNVIAYVMRAVLAVLGDVDPREGERHVRAVGVVEEERRGLRGKQ